MTQSELDSLYQQYLGRNVDASGASTWGNADYNTVVQGILGSQEYQNRQQTQQQQPTQQTTAQEPPPSWLLPADYAANGYAAPYTQQQITSQIDPSWIRQMNGQIYASVKGPSDLSGGEYLINPNTGKFALDKNGNPIGVTYAKSNNFDDWVTTPLGSLALTFGVPLAAMGGVAALEGLGAATGAGAAAEGAGAAGAVGQALPYTEAFDAANLYANGITDAGQLTDILTSTGMDPFLAADMGSLAAQGLSAEQIAQVIGYSYTPAELAGTGIKSLVPSALSAASLFGSGSMLGNAAKGAALGAALKMAGGSGLGGTMGGSGVNPFSGSGSLNAGLPGVIKGNENPFVFSKDLPVQDTKQASYNPFEALNVKEPIPGLPQNPYAKALQG